MLKNEQSEISKELQLDGFVEDQELSFDQTAKFDELILRLKVVIE